MLKVAPKARLKSEFVLGDAADSLQLCHIEQLDSHTFSPLMLLMNGPNDDSIESGPS